MSVLEFTIPTEKKDMTDEETSKIIIGLMKKILNGNKQLGSVAGLMKEKSTKSENKEGLEKVLNELSNTTNIMQEDVKASMTTTNFRYVKNLLKRTSEYASISSEIIKSMIKIVTESQTVDIGTYKKVLTASNTIRNSIFQMVDAMMYLSENKSSWADDTTEIQFFSIAKTMDKSITSLLEHKNNGIGDNIISKGNLAQIAASSVSSLISATRIIEEYQYPLCNPQDVIEDVKTAATSSSQLWATFEDSIKETDLSLTHSNLQQNLMNLLSETKKDYQQLIEEGKKASLLKLQNYSESLENNKIPPIPELKKCLEVVTKKVSRLLEVSVSLSESHISEVENKMVEVSPEEIKIASTILKNAFFKPLPKIPEEKELFKDYGMKDTNIWEEETNEDNFYMQDGKLKSGSFNKIVEKLTSKEFNDLKMLKTFAQTYRSFTTPEILFTKLKERYNVPEKDSKNQLQIQIRVVNVLKHWTDTQFNDFAQDSRLVNDLLSFLNELKNQKGIAVIANNISNMIENRRLGSEQNMNQQLNIEFEPKMTISPSKILFVFSEEEIAKQLTYIDNSIYTKIEAIELLNQAWSKDKFKYRSPNIHRMIARSNAITQWVCSLILWEKDSKDRAKTLTKLINIALHLKKLNNYQSLFGFISALNNSSIHRLKNTFSAVSQETTNNIDTLKNLIKSSQSYTNYRTSLRNANPPCIPFLGVYLTDLTFIEEGNQDFVVKKDVKYINFAKQELNHNVISEINQYQQTPYNIEYNERLGSYLHQLPYNDEDSLYKLSLIREPKVVANNITQTEDKDKENK